MEEIKIGGIITISENEKYIIIDILEESEKKYLLCSKVEKKIEPVIFEYKIINGKLNIRIEEEKEIIEKICLKIIKNT